MSDLQETLYEEFKAGKYESTQYLKNRRQEIREVTGLTVPRRAAEAENWYNSMKSTLSRKLNPENADELEDGDEEQDEGEASGSDEDEDQDN